MKKRIAIAGFLGLLTTLISCNPWEKSDRDCPHNLTQSVDTLIMSNEYGGLYGIYGPTGIVPIEEGYSWWMWANNASGGKNVTTEINLLLHADSIEHIIFPYATVGFGYYHYRQYFGFPDTLNGLLRYSKTMDYDSEQYFESCDEFLELELSIPVDTSQLSKSAEEYFHSIFHSGYMIMKYHEPQ